MHTKVKIKRASMAAAKKIVDEVTVKAQAKYPKNTTRRHGFTIGMLETKIARLLEQTAKDL